MTSTEPATADLLLDAQVAWLLDQLSGDRLAAVIDRDLDAVWAAAQDVRLDAIVTAGDVVRVVHHLLEVVPASTTTSTMLQVWTDVIRRGPAETVTPGELISDAHVDALLDEVLSRQAVLADGLDRLAESDLMGIVASRFIGRIVMDAVEMNRTMARKIPGVGSLVNLGTNVATNVASRAAAAADKPLQRVGDTAGKGAAFAVRRLNKVVLDTLADPTTKDAAMEVWGIAADTPIGPLAGDGPAEDVLRIVGLLQEVVIAGAPTDAVTSMATALVEAFFEVYGEHPVTTLLEELGLPQELVSRELHVVVPRVIDAAREDGRLEAALRERLQPFFASPAVVQILSS